MWLAVDSDPHVTASIRIFQHKQCLHLFSVCVLHVSHGLVQEPHISPDESAVLWMRDVAGLGLLRGSYGIFMVLIDSERIETLRHRFIKDPEGVWTADVEERELNTRASGHSRVTVTHTHWKHSQTFFFRGRHISALWYVCFSIEFRIKRVQSCWRPVAMQQWRYEIWHPLKRLLL